MGSERYSKLPTGPMPVTALSGPSDGAEGDAVARADWTPDDSSASAAPRPRREKRLAPWALTAAVFALIASFFVGWGIPVAILAIVVSVMALRRDGENRSMAIWALVLGVVASIYSLGWLAWAAYRAGWLG